MRTVESKSRGQRKMNAGEIKEAVGGLLRRVNEVD